MDTSFEVTKSTGVATVAGISSGSPGSVTLVYYGSKGAKRHFVQQVPVQDTAIFQRLQDGVMKGDQIQAVVINEWHTSGCVTYLADFKKAPIVEQEIIATNGIVNVVPNDIREITFPSANSVTTRARK